MGVISCGTTMLDAGEFQGIDVLNWDTTAKTGNFTAVAGNGYFVNTTSGAITVTLPAGSAGDTIALADYAATWDTNPVTVSPNGSDKIGGVNLSVALATEGQSVTLIFVDSTQGWLNILDSTSNIRASEFVKATGGSITICGDYKIHTFLGPGTFGVTSAGSPTGSNTVDYLVVAGGGGGGGGGPNGQEGGGAGAGGYRESSGAASGCYSTSPLGSGVSALPVTATAYPISVGGGGSSSGGSGGSNGANSSFSSITSAGGGGGGGSSPTSASSGGSGGGGNGALSGTGGGSGNTPPVSPPQGNNGSGGLSGPNRGGGGGGATAASSSSTNGGNGGTSSINASSTTRAGGGGGSSGGSGGSGGGADGVTSPGSGNNGDANTGGGGSGALFNPTGGNGGSGIVIIRYKFQ